MIINVILIEQNGMEFYIGSINFKDFKNKFEIVRRKENDNGVQRNLDKNRLDNLREFIKTGNSIFPQPIIVSLNNDMYDIKQNINYNNNDNNNIFQLNINEDNSIIGEIIDGQHRWEGLKESMLDDIILPIIFFLDISLYEKAYIFKTINANQKPISKSHLFDLYELSENRSPEKIMHIIVKRLNDDKDSPFYKRVKMLGKATDKRETISQGTMITYLLKFITLNSEKDRLILERNEIIKDNEKCPLRKFFIENKDEIILKVIYNFFLVLKELFRDEWDNVNEYVFLKTVGFGGLCRFARTVIAKQRIEKDLSKEALKRVFEKVDRNYLLDIFKSDNKLMGEAGQKIISDRLNKLIYGEK